MLLEDLPLINDAFFADSVTPSQLDVLLADGWRHFGERFYRYSLGVHDNDIRLVLPLRIRLADFRLSKSQRRILRKNADLVTAIRPIEITHETFELFESHKRRFKRDLPDSIYDFLSPDPANVPTAGYEVCVTRGSQLMAKSFFDVGDRSLSSIYGIFEPGEAPRSLGIYTLLAEITHGIESGKEFLYSGYAYEGESFYDYKKRFSGLEFFDWKGNWKPYLTAVPEL